jgi:hypothetical protein
LPGVRSRYCIIALGGIFFALTKALLPQSEDAFRARPEPPKNWSGLAVKVAIRSRRVFQLGGLLAEASVI